MTSKEEDELVPADKDEDLLEEEDDLLDAEEACKEIGGRSHPIHLATFYRGIKAGRYPPGIPVAPNVRRWRRRKLKAAIAAAEREAERAAE